MNLSNILFIITTKINEVVITPNVATILPITPLILYPTKVAEFIATGPGVICEWDDLERFPVGTVASDGNAGVSFADSWMQSRNFGGERGHEGCDIMASVNERGIYPIYSVSDGVVENVGWLRLGGYRIGIRSPSGAYFYYAHLAEYAKEFEVGETVLAGTHLGYMGDTGYSDIPGTTGNFPVHLHFGIYINDENGQELSVNPYPMVLYLWEQQGKYTFGETKRQ